MYYNIVNTSCNVNTFVLIIGNLKTIADRRLAKNDDICGVLVNNYYYLHCVVIVIIFRSFIFYTKEDCTNRFWSFGIHFTFLFVLVIILKHCFLRMTFKTFLTRPSEKAVVRDAVGSNKSVLPLFRVENFKIFVRYLQWCTCVMYQIPKKREPQNVNVQSATHTRVRIVF